VTRELSGRLLIGGELVEGTLSLADGRIASVAIGPTGESDPPVIAPGLIDLHTHGFGGCDPLEDLAGMARALAGAGTTAFQPTLFPARPEELGEHAAQAWAAAQRSNAAGGGALAIGLHLEGPFVNPERAGALPPEAIVAPSVEGLRQILGPATGDGRGVRTVTLAPELPGAAELIEELGRAGVRVSLGHSSATASEARSAARAGAVGATHLFNAMSGVHHRKMGLAGFALSAAALHAELIGDLVHVYSDAVELALAARGPEGLCLVSDSLPGAGTGCEVFHWHGREHEVREGAAWYRPGGPSTELALTGSAMGQLEMVRRLATRGVVTLAEALTMAAETPARALGLERDLGRLVPGARADLLVLRGAELELEAVLVAGRPLTQS
jgi:N-acetylglucosamine-6-phosphate deacetylase